MSKDPYADAQRRLELLADIPPIDTIRRFTVRDRDLHRPLFSERGASLDESRIIWFENPLQFPYLRESTYSIPLTGKKWKWDYDVGPNRYLIVGLATLVTNPTYEPTGIVSARRWYLKPHDPYEDGGAPWEAVDPATIRVGIPSYRYLHRTQSRPDFSGYYDDGRRQVEMVQGGTAYRYPDGDGRLYPCRVTLPPELQ